MPASDGPSGAATAGAPRHPSSSLIPAIVALATILAIQFGANMTQIAFGLVTDTPYQPPNPIARMSLVQSDLRIIHKATQGYLAGAEDYDAVRQYARSHDPWTRRFPGAPIGYRLVAAMNLLSERAVHWLWLLAVPVCVLVSLLVATRMLVPAEGGEGRLVFLLTLLVLLASTPFLFQIERGNVDWIAFTLYMMALAGLSRGHSYGSGVLLGVATAVKLYPGSLFLLLAGTFLAMAFVRQRRAPIDVGRVGLMAIPFMFLMPLTHWAYALFALVALLPLLCTLYREREDLRPPVLAVSALIGVTQAPFVALRCFPVGLSIVMPVYSACVLCLSLLSIWLVARGAADGQRSDEAMVPAPSDC